jgi:hypothetical protein
MTYDGKVLDALVVFCTNICQVACVFVVYC